MPCAVVKHLGPSGEVTVIACARGRSAQPPCVYCGAAGKKLCDFPLAGALAGKTCDRPMCRRCAHHVDGADLDYCRPHAAARDAQADGARS